MTPIETILSRLESVTGRGPWQAKCPAHDDRTASLSLSEGRDDRVLIHCHAGCATRDVLDALSMTWNDLYASKVSGHWVISECYDYTDEEGALLFQSVRLIPKSFRQRVPDGDGWRWSLGDVRIVPYRLPRILQAKGVFIVEGERDVHTLEHRGFTATCNAGGAGKWRDEFARYLAGRYVYVLPDNDEPGRLHAHHVARSLAGCAEVRIVDLPVGEKGDVTDFFNQGGTVDDLKALVRKAPRFRRSRDWLVEAAGHITRLNGHDPAASAFVKDLRRYLGN